MDKLIRLINYYDYMLHINNQPIISEEEYDSLRRELENLEKDFPQYVYAESPTFIINSGVKNNKKIQRKHPMLSIRHTYSKDEALRLVNDMLKTNLIVIIQPKIDGVAAEISYVDGIIDSLSLRGDGRYGEDISHYIPYVKNINLNIEHFTGQIRGEIYVPKNLINSNYRNYVAGALRKKIASDHNLIFLPYKVIGTELQFYIDELKFLELNFAKVVPYKISDDLNEIVKLGEEIWQENFDFVIDGSVFRSNLDDATFVGRYHNNILAYKFSNDLYSTVVKSIEWNVNRSGQLIPVCLVEPINIDGSTIKRIHAHNKRYLQIQKIGINTVISICRKGNVIPKIVSVLKNETNIQLENCPNCHGDISETDLHYFCISGKCIELKKNIFFFKNLNIDGLSDQILNKFVNYSILEIIEKIKTLGWCENLNEQKAQNLFEIKRKNISLKDILSGLSIAGISHGFLEKLPEFNSLEDLLNLDFPTETGKNFQQFIKTNRDWIEKIYKSLIE